jgi:hypothetical protein
VTDWQQLRFEAALLIAIDATSCSFPVQNATRPEEGGRQNYWSRVNEECPLCVRSECLRKGDDIYLRDNPDCSPVLVKSCRREKREGSLNI